MGRKAKEAAQKKIGEWTGNRRNVSKAETKTTTKSENANASNENRTPLQTQTQSDINAMKNCTVRLEKMPIAEKQNGKVKKTPVKKVPAANAMTKDKQAETKNVYDDYSFDADEIPLQSGDEMKDLFEKMAKENKIEVKKYRPKNVKKKKTDEKVPAKKTVTQKRRREKQPLDAEPPQKKPNLKNKATATVTQKTGTSSSNAITTTSKQNAKPDNVANNNNSIEILSTVVIPAKTTAITKSAINTEHVNAQPRLRNRNLNHLNDFQSTPKSSTPLGTKSTASTKENDRSLNSLFFTSPLAVSTRGARANLMKQRLQLSAINDSQEEESTSSAQNNEGNDAPAPVIDFGDDDFDFGNNAAANQPEPELDVDVDKENSLDRPGTSSSTQSSSNRVRTSTTVRPGTSSAPSTSWDQPSTSATARTPLRNATISTSWDQPSTSAAVKTPLRNANDQSLFDIDQNTSDYRIFSPTKRRVYGRSPLKNITSEVNNTNSPSFESIKSIATMPQSFGSLAKSTLNSISTKSTSKDADITLPEGSYFSSRRAAADFDRSIDSRNFVDDCFGFDEGDEEVDINNDTLTNEPNDQTTKDSEKEPRKETLAEIRAKLKRFLVKQEKADGTVKKTRIDGNDKFKKKNVRSPMKTATTMESPAKAVRTPVKKTPVKRNVVFGDTGAKQKDIRTAFTAKSSDKNKHTKLDDGPITLFEEIDTNQDRRRSYSRPQRQRKRRISVDSEESEEEQQSEDEDFNVDGKPSKRAKRRKKTVAPNPKELEELEEFARTTNAHFEEIDSFTMVVE